jgi:hypothetical protein
MFHRVDHTLMPVKQVGGAIQGFSVALVNHLLQNGDLFWA